MIDLGSGSRKRAYPWRVCFLVAVVLLEAAPAAASEPVAEVTVSRANVRRGPSAGERRVGRASRGDGLPVIGEAEGWVRVRLPDGTLGWIRRDLVRLRPGRASGRRDARAPRRPPAPASRRTRSVRGPGSPVTQEYLEAREREAGGWVKLVLGGTAAAAGLGSLYLASLMEEAGAGGAGLFLLAGLAGLAGGGGLAYWGWQDVEPSRSDVRRRRARLPGRAAPGPALGVGWSWEF